MSCEKAVGKALLVLQGDECGHHHYDTPHLSGTLCAQWGWLRAADHGTATFLKIFQGYRLDIREKKALRLKLRFVSMSAFNQVGPYQTQLEASLKKEC